MQACLTKKCVASFLCLLTTLSAYAQSDYADRRNYLIENDTWGRPASDRNYTMGVSITDFNHVPDPQAAPIWLTALSGLNRYLGMQPISQNTPAHWIIASSNYTPKDIVRREPIIGDRPFSSLLYVGAGYWSMSDEITTETQFQLGLLGTKIGSAVQHAIHEVCCKDRLPGGWGNQIGDGGSPTFLYHVKWSRPLSVLQSQRAAIVVGAGGELGYMTRGLVGATLYIGATPEDFRYIYGQPTGNPTANALPISGSVPQLQSVGNGFSVWLDLEASFLTYNQLLQGAWFGRNAVSYRYSEIEPIVRKLNAGVELTFVPRLLGLCDRHCRIYFTQSWRSRDLRTSLDTRHYWGGLILSTQF